MRELEGDHSLASLKMQLAALLPEQDGRQFLSKVARLERALAADVQSDVADVARSPFAATVHH